MVSFSYTYFLRVALAGLCITSLSVNAMNITSLIPRSSYVSPVISMSASFLWGHKKAVLATAAVYGCIYLTKQWWEKDSLLELQKRDIERNKRQALRDQEKIQQLQDAANLNSEQLGQMHYELANNSDLTARNYELSKKNAAGIEQLHAQQGSLQATIVENNKGLHEKLDTNHKEIMTRLDRFEEKNKERLNLLEKALSETIKRAVIGNIGLLRTNAVNQFLERLAAGEQVTVPKKTVSGASEEVD